MTTTMMITYGLGSMEVRFFCVTSKTKVRQVYKSNTIIGELRAEIKRLRDILKLYGLDAYTHYPFAINNTNKYTLDALRSNLGKKEAKKSREEFRAYVIGKSESNTSIDLMNDKDKEH